MKLVYFASVREAIGCDEEERALPAEITTIAACVDWLASEDDRYGAAFSDRSKLRFALDQKMAGEDTPIKNAAELAIFPPVTGG